jgi:sugar/nucleoside kinase (ribokinase family)
MEQQERKTGMPPVPINGRSQPSTDFASQGLSGRVSRSGNDRPATLAVGAIYRDLVAHGQHVEISIGGVCNNVSRHLAQAGLDVDMLTMLEPGLVGDEALEAYRGLPINVVTTRVGGSLGEFRVALTDGVTRVLGVRHPDCPLPPAHIELLHERVRHADFLVIELGMPRELVSAALDVGKERGLCRIGLPTRVDTIQNWAELLGELEVLILNCQEAASILEFHEPLEVAQAPAAIEALLAHGLQVVVITFDSRGAVVAAPGEPTQWVPAPEVDVVSTLGAGDALAAGTIIGLAQGLSAPVAVRQAMPRVRQVLQSMVAFPQ